MKRVILIGSAEQSGGGVSSVLKLMKKMPVWEKYSCYWLGTQIQAGKWTKLWYAIKAYVIAFFIIRRYDIVHFHTVPNISMKIQLPVFLLAKLWHKKVVLHLHCGNQLTWMKYRKSKIAHWCMKKSHHIILLSKIFEEYLDEYWSDIKTPRSVIYNACEDVIALPYNQHENYILMAGAINWNKACDTLVSAFARIHIKYPDWKVVLLGSGPDEQKIKELIKKEGIENKVIMPGYLFGEDVKKYFRTAGIYCMSSKVEGFPMVVLEAWAYGVPVVTTPVGGLPDVIEDGKNCMVFSDYKNDKMLALKLEQLITNIKLRTELSEYSQAFGRKHFSMRTINNEIDNFYKTL